MTPSYKKYMSLIFLIHLHLFTKSNLSSLQNSAMRILQKLFMTWHSSLPSDVESNYPPWIHFLNLQALISHPPYPMSFSHRLLSECHYKIGCYQNYLLALVYYRIVYRSHFSMNYQNLTYYLKLLPDWLATKCHQVPTFSFHRACSRSLVPTGMTTRSPATIISYILQTLL